MTFTAIRIATRGAHWSACAPRLLTAALLALALAPAAAAIGANAFTEVMAAKDGGEETTVSPEPAKTTEDMMSSNGVATTDTSLSAAETPDVASQPEGSAADPDAAEIADEVATAAEVGDDTTGVVGRAATAGNSADPATTDEAVQAVNGDQLQENADADTGVAGLTVCEIDQATAEQSGFPAEG